MAREQLEAYVLTSLLHAGRHPFSDLLAGNDQHTSIEAMGPGAKQDAAEIAPAGNNLFTSGTLGRYSNTLNAVMENRNPEPAEVPAD